MKARDASERLKQWLGKYLPIYEAQLNRCQQLDSDTSLQLEFCLSILH